MSGTVAFGRCGVVLYTWQCATSPRAVTGGDVRAAEYGDSAADDVSAWTEVIEVVVIFVRSEGGYALTGYNDQGEAIFERTAWSVGLPAVKAEVVALAAERDTCPTASGRRTRS